MNKNLKEFPRIVYYLDSDINTVIVSGYYASEIDFNGYNLTLNYNHRRFDTEEECLLACNIHNKFIGMTHYEIEKFYTNPLLITNPLFSEFFINSVKLPLEKLSSLIYNEIKEDNNQLLLSKYYQLINDLFNSIDINIQTELVSIYDKPIFEIKEYYDIMDLILENIIGEDCTLNVVQYTKYREYGGPEEGGWYYDNYVPNSTKSFTLFSDAYKYLINLEKEGSKNIYIELYDYNANETKETPYYC